jgi:hypothetical protein
MPTQIRICSPGPADRTVRTASGQVLSPPAGWALLPPGDAGLTRRVKAAGPSWTVQEKVGRKLFSRGVWAPAAHIAAARSALDAERATPQYAKKQQAAAAKRDREQGAYVEDFYQAVLDFLAFSPNHADLARQFATAVAAHATPVGSGTVARTKRIPIEERAQAAVIAWMRHQTTAYDNMKIARVKGERREVRRMLAARSRELLDAYRVGREPAVSCPLRRALSAVAASSH